MIRTLAVLAATTAGTVGIGGAALPTANAEEFTVCPSGRTGVATDDTSCAFAENVRSAWLAQPGNVVTAFSPVTQQTYTMQCASTVTDSWPVAERCVGVNSYGVGLIVFIATPSGGGSGPVGQSAIPPEQSGVSAPSVGIGVDSPNIPNVNAPNTLPNVNAPNVGCTWVDGYTRSNGTHVSGYLRC